jgi:hypothetical protein
MSPPQRRSGRTNSQRQPTIHFTAVVRPATASADSNTPRIDESEPLHESIENATPAPTAFTRYLHEIYRLLPRLKHLHRVPPLVRETELILKLR